MTATFASDFETTTDPLACRVWAWQCRNIDTDEVYQGTDIRTFVDNAPDGLHYFHNLGFDAAFIMDVLVRVYGQKYVELDQSPEGKARGDHELRDGQFTGLISEKGAHYSFTFNNAQGEVRIQDSLKKVPGTLAVLGLAYGAEVKKGSIDYDAPRPEGYEPTKEEWEYLDNDTAILAHVLRAVISEGYTSMTIGGDCFRDWKKTLHAKYGAENGNNTTKTFRDLCPVMDYDTEMDLRKAYRGGWTFVNPEIQGKVLTQGGVVYDVNSMYPAVQVQEVFPVGMPYRLAPDEKAPRSYPLEIRGKVVTYSLRKGGIPSIPKNAESFGSNGYSFEADEVELWGTGQEWELWEKMYDMDVECDLGGYAFMAMSGDELFGDYIRHYMEIKATAKGSKRLLAKLSLNNLWGRLGQHPMRGKRFPEILSDGNPVTLTCGPIEWSEPVYTAIAIFTTAYARIRIVTAAYENRDRFCYADTDSLHLTGFEPPVGITVHDSDLGAWAHEGTWSEGVYARAKAYVERMTEESDACIVDEATGLQNIQVAMAGLPAAAREGLTPESVRDGQEFDGKLARRRVVGGIVLSPVKWKLDYRYGIIETSDPVVH